MLLMIQAVIVTILLVLNLIVMGETAVAASLHQAAAQEYMTSEQWDYAAYEWRKTLEENPKNIRAHIGLSKSLRNGGYVQEAIRHLISVRSSVKDTAIEIELADAYRQAGKLTRACDGYVAILKRQPFHTEAYRNLMDMRKLVPASRRKNVALLLENTARQAMEKAGELSDAGRYRESLPYFEIATAYFNQRDLLNDYGLVLMLSGDGMGASRQFQHLSRLKPTWESHANAALVALSLDKSYAARKQLETALALAPGNAEKARLYNILGYIHELSSRPAEARFAYEKAIELDPSLDKPRLNLAYVLEQDYQLERAVEIYRAMLKANPDHPDTWTRLGFAYELMHEPKKAIDAYRKALALNPAHEDAHYNLGMLYRKMDKQKQADEHLRKLADMKFQALEKRTAAGKAAVDTDLRHPLFRYVDVFFTGAHRNTATASKVSRTP